MLERVLADVRAAVEDWRPMLAKVDDAIADLRRGAKVLEATELAEAEAFLRWIADNHFTLLGYGCYDLIRDQGGRSAAAGRGLGARPAAPPADRQRRPRAASPRLPPERRRRRAIRRRW